MVYCSNGVSSHNDLGLAQRIEDLAVAQAQFPYCAGARNWSRALRVAQQHEIPAKYGLVLGLRVPVDQFLKIKGMVRIPGRSRPRIRSDLARRSEMISPAIRG